MQIKKIWNMWTCLTFRFDQTNVELKTEIPFFSGKKTRESVY